MSYGLKLRNKLSCEFSKWKEVLCVFTQKLTESKTGFSFYLSRQTKSSF